MKAKFQLYSMVVFRITWPLLIKTVKDRIPIMNTTEMFIGLWLLIRGNESQTIGGFIISFQVSVS